MGRQFSIMLRLRRTNRAAVQRVRYVLRKMTYPQNEQIEYNTAAGPPPEGPKINSTILHSPICNAALRRLRRGWDFHAGALTPRNKRGRPCAGQRTKNGECKCRPLQAT